MIKLEWCKVIYDFYNNAIPLSLQQLFTYISDIHGYNTRQSTARKIFLLSVRTEKEKNFVAFKCVKFRNDLDISIRETKPKHKFIKKFKKLVFESYQ